MSTSLELILLSCLMIIFYYLNQIHFYITHISKTSFQKLVIDKRKDFKTRFKMFVCILISFFQVIVLIFNIKISQICILYSPFKYICIRFLKSLLLIRIKIYKWWDSLETTFNLDIQNFRTNVANISEENEFFPDWILCNLHEISDHKHLQECAFDAGILPENERENESFT